MALFTPKHSNVGAGIEERLVFNMRLCQVCIVGMIAKKITRSKLESKEQTQ